MFKLFKGAKVYAPEYLGAKDVLISNGKINLVDKNIEITGLKDVEVIDANGLIMTPGFIDQHVHICGGGGEGGFDTRTKEIDSSELLKYGITTVVGILGVDGITRNVEALYAKAKSLEHEGVNTYIYTGSYQVPVITLTDSIQRDIVFIDKVIGVGEIAISDTRSYNPSIGELSRIAAEARMGGLISGKAGVVHLHLGDSKEGLNPIYDVLKSTMLPILQFVPSHVNRNERLFSQASMFCKDGGYIDLTCGFEREVDVDKCIPAYEGLKKLLESDAPMERVVMSSDANGSIPVFDENGQIKGVEAASCKVLYEDFKKAVMEYDVPFEIALATITSNPARLLKLKDLGTIEAGKKANILLLDKELNIVYVNTNNTNLHLKGHK